MSAVSSCGGMLRGSRFVALARPALGISLRMLFHRYRYVGISLPGMLSATGTRGSFTIPHSMASMSEKSDTVHGNSVPSAYPEPRKKNGVAERSMVLCIPSFRFMISSPDIHSLAASLFFFASVASSRSSFCSSFCPGFSL